MKCLKISQIKFNNVKILDKIKENILMIKKVLKAINKLFKIKNEKFL